MRICDLLMILALCFTNHNTLLDVVLYVTALVYAGVRIMEVLK